MEFEPEYGEVDDDDDNDDEGVYDEVGGGMGFPFPDIAKTAGE